MKDAKGTKILNQVKKVAREAALHSSLRQKKDVGDPDSELEASDALEKQTFVILEH